MNKHLQLKFKGVILLAFLLVPAVLMLGTVSMQAASIHARPTRKATLTVTKTLTLTPVPTSTASRTPRPSATLTSMPNAQFTAVPPSGVVPLTVRFTNSTASPLEYCQWTFGDGSSQIISYFTATPTPGSGQDAYWGCPVSHTYTSAGTFLVRLDVRKKNTGASASWSMYVYVTEALTSTATSTPTP